MIRKRGLASKLSRYVLSMVFIVLSAVLVYNYIISRDLALRDAQKDVQSLTELTVAQIESVLNSVENIPTSLASVIQHRDTVRFVGTRLVIEEVLMRNPFVYGASISFAPGITGTDTQYFAPYLHFDGDSLIFKDLSLDKSYGYTNKPWYTMARDSARGIWSEPYYDLGGGNALMATYSVPFYRKRGDVLQFSGVVTADLSLSGLQDLIDEIRFFKSGRGFLISSLGNIVTFPDIDSADNKLVYNIFDQVDAPGLTSVLRRMTAGESGIVSMRDIGAEQNLDQWISYSSVPSANWSLGIIFEEEELYEGIHILYLKLIAIGFAGFLVLAFLIDLIARRFVKPLEKLAQATQRIGAGELNYQIPSYGSKDEVAQLGNSFRLMQQQLREYIANLKETTALKERIESELEIASTIQQQMLPAAEKIPGFDNIDIIGLLRPARQVGGDFYDFLSTGEYLYFTVGDVSGKGIPAALFMAKSITLFRTKAGRELNPSMIATEMNNDLEQYNAQSMFVTCFIGRLHLESGAFEYTNAGHNPPFMWREDSTEEIRKVHGIPLGSLPGIEYAQESLKINTGTGILLYTDGVSEASDRNDVLFGEQKIAKVLKDHKSDPVRKLADRLLAEVDTFANGTEQSDDITLLILSYK